MHRKSGLLAGVRPSRRHYRGVEYSCLKGTYTADGVKLFLVLEGDTGRVSGHGLQCGRFMLDIRENFFPVRGFQDWNRLLVEAEKREIFIPGRF